MRKHVRGFHADLLDLMQGVKSISFLNSVHISRLSTFSYIDSVQAGMWLKILDK